MGAATCTSTLDAALRYAADFDWHVFPVGPDKKPVTPHGFKDATNDPARIRELWRDNPAANIAAACGASGLVVIDLDIKNGADGLVSWAELTAGHEPIGTATAQTPSGGRHIFFSLPELASIRNSAGKLAAGVDVRADGGYIVLPPSCTADGKYKWDTPPETGIAPIPEWLLKLVARPEPKTTPAPTPRNDRDLGPYLGAAIAGEVENIRAADNGTRNDTINRAAFNLGGLIVHGLPEDRIVAELLDAATAAGLPVGEAKQTIRSGIAGGRNNPRDIPEGQPTNIKNLEVEPRTEPAEHPTFTLTAADILNAGEPPAPIFAGGPVAGVYGVLAGESGRSKTYEALMWAVQQATGWTLQPAFQPRDRQTVLFLSYEDPAEIIKWRLDRIAETQHGLGQEINEALEAKRLQFFVDLPGPLFAYSSGLVAPTPVFRELDALVGHTGAGVVVIDTFSGATALKDENSSAEVNIVASHLAGLAKRQNCFVLLIHHTGKVNAENASQHSLRGSSALAGRARWIAQVTPHANDLDAVVLTVVKNSYARCIDPVLLQRDGAGVPIQYIPPVTAARDLVEFMAGWLHDNPDADVTEGSVKQPKGDGGRLRGAILDVYPLATSKDISAALAEGRSRGVFRVVETVNRNNRKRQRIMGVAA